METISLVDGLILTVVSMLLVFMVLGAIGFLIDVTAKIVNKEEVKDEVKEEVIEVPAKLAITPAPLQANEKNQFVAEMMALVLASEDEPNRKFEVIEAKRIK